tara:strand:- start:1494 stop:3773 length:2280 start_codon:yes stop_codon:yes gene_type:complete
MRKVLENLGFNPSTEPRMFCYLWDEINVDDESKFGERWVFPGQEPIDECLKRIRTSLGVRKDIFDSGLVNVPIIWDVTEYAKSINRYYKSSRVDDKIREHIGFRKNKTGEIHTLSSIDMKIKVENFLSSQNIDKPIVRLSSGQYNEVAEIKNAISNGKRRILAELAARFGKTLGSASISLENEIQLTVVTSYVKTVFTSFQTDINSFEQFKHIVHINTADKDYQSQIQKGLLENKQIFVYVSLVNGTNRDKRMKFLCGLAVSRMVIVDEGDFGAHQEKQVTVLKENIKDDDVLLIMTGTNSDRASSSWEIDYMTSVTYFELLVSKRESNEIKSLGGEMISNPLNLKYFTKNLERDLLYPSIQGYQMDLISSVNLAITRGLLTDEDFKKLPSWQKFVQHPIKGKGWFITLLESLFKGKHSLDSLNVDLQTESYGGRRVAMMFLPDNTKKTNLTTIVNIVSETLSDYVVIELSGNVTTQKEAEKLVKETMEKNPNKSILIISAKMAQRSFSIKQLDELYLCYDKGQNGATIQKMSRALTPNDVDKVGKIFSLSFDSNRDDKFDTLLVQTALNLLKGKKTQTDINEQLRRILSSIDIFSCTEAGSIKIDIDTFVESALSRKTISRVMGMKTDINGIPMEVVTALANGNIDYIKNESRENAKTGKTKETTPTNKRKQSDLKPMEVKNLQKVREMLTTIYEHSDILMRSAKTLGATNIRQAFKMFESKNWQSIIGSEFGVDFNVIKYLFESGRINENWVNILHK